MPWAKSYLIFVLGHLKLLSYFFSAASKSTRRALFWREPVDMYMFWKCLAISIERTPCPFQRPSSSQCYNNIDMNDSPLRNVRNPLKLCNWMRWYIDLTNWLSSNLEILGEINPDYQTTYCRISIYITPWLSVSLGRHKCHAMEFHGTFIVLQKNSKIPLMSW